MDKRTAAAADLLDAAADLLDLDGVWMQGTDHEYTSTTLCGMKFCFRGAIYWTSGESLASWAAAGHGTATARAAAARYCEARATADAAMRAVARRILVMNPPCIGDLASFVTVDDLDNGRTVRFERGEVVQTWPIERYVSAIVTRWNDHEDRKRDDVVYLCRATADDLRWPALASITEPDDTRE